MFFAADLQRHREEIHLFDQTRFVGSHELDQADDRGPETVAEIPTSFNVSRLYTQAKGGV